MNYLQKFLAKPNYQSELQRLRIRERLDSARANLLHVQSPEYRKSLDGMIGTDPALVD